MPLIRPRRPRRPHEQGRDGREAARPSHRCPFHTGPRFSAKARNPPIMPSPAAEAVHAREPAPACAVRCGSRGGTHVTRRRPPGSVADGSGSGREGAPPPGFIAAPPPARAAPLPAPGQAGGPRPRQQQVGGAGGRPPTSPDASTGRRDSPLSTVSGSARSAASRARAAATRSPRTCRGGSSRRSSRPPARSGARKAEPDGPPGRVGGRGQRLERGRTLPSTACEYGPRTGAEPATVVRRKTRG